MYTRLQFPPKVDYGGPNYWLQASWILMRLTLTGPAGLCWQLDRSGRVAWQLQHCVSHPVSVSNIISQLTQRTCFRPLGRPLSTLLYSSLFVVIPSPLPFPHTIAVTSKKCWHLGGCVSQCLIMVRVLLHNHARKIRLRIVYLVF